MRIEPEQIREYRLRVHHLDEKMPADSLLAVAGVCGLQNSPPGAWETAMFNRMEGCALQMLQDALYKEKSLLQAWSYRGAPVVFPTEERDVFLTALLAQEEEYPWIYTKGISAALDFLQMPFDELLQRTKEAIVYLDDHTIRSKELLDQTLAEIVRGKLPKEKWELWNAPSMYGSPDKQTVGGAAVSFLLRPCAFASLVVFGEREGLSPTFTSLKNWTGHAPAHRSDERNADRKLICKFLHAYGPATPDSFMGWLGCSKQQAKRLWETAADEMEPVSLGKKTCYMLRDDLKSLSHFGATKNRLILLGAHDPYLDIRDRNIILDAPSLQKLVWKTVANPGVILKGGRIAGIWKTKTQRGQIELSMNLFEPLSDEEQQRLRQLALEYAEFRRLELKDCRIFTESDGDGSARLKRST